MAFSSLASLLVILVALNHYGWQVPWLGLLLGAAYLALTSWRLGGRLTGLARGSAERLLGGLGVTVVLVAVFGTLTFYLHSFGRVATLALAFALPWFGSSRKVEPLGSTEATESRTVTWVAAAAMFALSAGTTLVVASARTDAALRTPWAQVSPLAFVLLAGAALAAVLALRHLRSAGWLLPTYACSLTLLPLVYPLGYGFDPFIHQATEVLLQSRGTVSPMPLYYLGQYADVTWLANLLAVPVTLVDMWLVPVLAAVLVPLLAVWLSRALKLRYPLLVSLVPLALTLTAFTYTTPQNLSYLFAFAAAVLVGVRLAGGRAPAAAPLGAALAALAAHPLTGFPTLAVVALWWVNFERPHLTQKLRWLSPTLAAGIVLAVPLALVLFTWLSPGSASLGLNRSFLGAVERLGADTAAALPFLPRAFAAQDAVYLLGQPLTLLTLLLAAWGWLALPATCRRLRLLGLAAGLAAASYLVLRLGVTFPNLPANEQGFYSDRLFELARLFALPLAMFGAAELTARLGAKFKSAAPLAVAFALSLAAGFYLTYPRLDLYHRDTAYNTTPADVTAVELVNREAGSEPYVVLANQAVAAAAVRQFGFAHYEHGYFYYPLPTGTNPLYQVFLEAAERGFPTKATVQTAADVAGVTQVFFILNRYWANADTLADVAAQEADANWDVAGGAVRVYRYQFGL